LIAIEALMRPEIIVKDKIFGRFRIIWVNYSCNLSHHINTQITIRLLLSVAKWPNSHPYFDIHLFNLVL